MTLPDNQPAMSKHWRQICYWDTKCKYCHAAPASHGSAYVSFSVETQPANSALRNKSRIVTALDTAAYQNVWWFCLTHHWWPKLSAEIPAIHINWPYWAGGHVHPVAIPLFSKQFCLQLQPCFQCSFWLAAPNWLKLNSTFISISLTLNRFILLHSYYRCYAMMLCALLLLFMQYAQMEYNSYQKAPQGGCGHRRQHARLR